MSGEFVDNHVLSSGIEEGGYSSLVVFRGYDANNVVIGSNGSGTVSGVGDNSIALSLSFYSDDVSICCRVKNLGLTEFTSGDDNAIRATYLNNGLERLVDIESYLNYYETLYDMSSDNFVKKWKSGGLPDKSDFFDWINLYRRYEYQCKR